MAAWSASEPTLVDLLDRLLDRGLVVNADIVISLAGVPLIGINLRAALAGMETMVQYGLMEEWDRRLRASAGRLQSAETPALAQPLTATAQGVRP